MFKRDTVDELRAFGFDLRLAFEDDPTTSPCSTPRESPASTSTPGYYD